MQDTYILRGNPRPESSLVPSWSTELETRDLSLRTWLVLSVQEMERAWALRLQFSPATLGDHSLLLSLSFLICTMGPMKSNED